MTYKLGDRVVVKIAVVIEDNKYLGPNKSGIVTATTSSNYMVGVTIEGSNIRMWFETDEIEHDKNYIVTQILEDL